MRRIVQFSAGFNEGDAISNYMLILKNRIQESGLDCEIYSQNIGIDDKKICRKYTHYKPRAGDCILYHHSIHSKILDFIKDQCKSIYKVLVYHNVTPYEYMLPYDLTLSYYLKKGREELVEYKTFFDKNFAVSNFNKKELEDLGFRDVKFLPLIISLDDQPLPKNIQEETFQILFVGRIAPNKKQSDLVRLAKILKDYFPLKFRISMVGKTSREMKLYKEEIENLINYFSVENEIDLLDFLDRDELKAVYSRSDLFLCMSEHEGFCVPLIEAMHFGIPIMAYAGGAIPETLDGSGILFREKKFDLIAAMVFKLATDTMLRNRILQGQSERLDAFKRTDTFRILKTELGLKDN
ncbi:MAG: glycosyltransferase family 4 protein [Leptospiraceae bacterium]|nr:glycosyltransferase family 4 protein [Leptospiraceae bacterium]MCP5510463.1 glycosyltransferase family 4 protein [Leptospiraceae bacterium]